MEGETSNKNLKGFLYAFGGTFLVSTNYVTAKYGLGAFNPETFSLVWTSAAAFYSFLVVLFNGQGRELRLSRESFLPVFFMGFFTGVGMILCWGGLKYLDPTFSAFLWRLQPVLTILLSGIFLKERLHWEEFPPLLLLVIGGCISTWGRWHIVGLGVVLTLSACFTSTIQVMLAKSMIRDIHPNILVFYRASIGSLFIALWTLLITKRGDFHIPLPYWGVTLLGAFLGPCASFLLTFRSYRYWELSRSSMVGMVSPLIALPLAYIFLNQFPAKREIYGGILILAGSFWLSWVYFFKRTPHQPL